MGESAVYTKQPTQAELAQLAEHLRSLEVESVAISFCNSYLYSKHEQVVKEFLEK